jgi:hypothetical protein
MAESAAIAQVREQTGKILTSDDCQKINFSLENVQIDGGGYFYVALALLNTNMSPSSVKFKIDPSISAGAEYHIKQNTFVFRTTGVAFDKGDGYQIIVHEATHAVIDSKSAKQKVLRVTNEMCAYIAGGLFNIIAGDNADDNYPIYREARAVAQKIIKVSKKWNYTGTYALYASDVTALRAAVLASPTYAGLQTDPNATYGDDGLPL